MKFTKQDQHKDGDTVPLAPLIDIVFLTLVFFMATAVFGALETEIDVDLPTADTAQEAMRTQGEIYINLRRDGTVVLNNREMTMDELQETLYQIAEYFPGGSVVIRGDQEAMLGHAIAILDRCRRADIQDVSFAAMPPSDPGEPAEAAL